LVISAVTHAGMDLGKAKLLRTGLNTLHRAVHPVHGIAWTDGKQVCLTSLFLVGGEANFGDTNVIGQFDHVLGLSWGPPCGPGSPALLAVQHEKHVTVWQLQLSALERNKLLCTQTCEASEPLPLLPQGCVWHPELDILAVLTKKDASLLFSVRVDNRRVRAAVEGAGPIHCACWTKDGARLVVAAGSSLLSYVWNDAQKSLAACSFCPVFDVGGYVCAIEATGGAQVAVATELPLDKLCGLNAGMAFDVASAPESPQGSGSPSEEDDFLDSRRRSFECESSSVPGSGPVDLTHLLAGPRRSDPSPLLHLRRRDTVTGSGRDASHLVLVTYERTVTTSRKVSIPGILVPDVVAFDPRGAAVAVASNSCNAVLVYRITAAAVPNVQQIWLAAGERPKGVCFLTDRLLLLMVGRQKSNDPAFLPASNADTFVLRLVAKELLPDGDAPAARVGRRSELLSRDERERPGATDLKDLVLPGGGVVRSAGPNRRRLVEELRSGEPSPVDFFERAPSAASSSVTVESFDTDHVRRVSCPAAAGHPRREPSDGRHAEPPAPPGLHARERGLEQLVLNMERLFSRFADVQQCLADIRDYNQNGKKAQSGYPGAADPPYVNVTCQVRLSGCSDPTGLKRGRGSLSLRDNGTV